MEHVNDQSPPFVCSKLGPSVIVMRPGDPRAICRVVDAFTEREQLMWGNRIARGLCYDVAGLQRAHRAGIRGLAIGFLLGAFLAGMLILAAGWKPPSMCVNVEPYGSVPNG